MGKTYTKYNVNEKFFDTFSSEMAYILGYIISDGSIDSRKRLRISSIDKQILEDILKAMDSNTPIKTESNKNGSWYTILISRQSIGYKLEEYGIHQNKTYDIEYPNIPNEYKRDFIRGLFDGDGSIYETNTPDRNTNKLNVEIASASQKFIKSLQIELSDVFKENKPNVLIKDKTQSKVMTVKFGAELAIKFYAYIYYPGCLHLNRKKDKFDNIIISRNNSPRVKHKTNIIG